MASSPTSRSNLKLKAEGWTTQIVEHWNGYAKKRLDLYNIIDIVGIKATIGGVLGVQTTSNDNVSHRVEKALEEPKLGIWLAAGNGFEIHGWAKKGPRGKRKVWTCRVINLGDLINRGVVKHAFRLGNETESRGGVLSGAGVETQGATAL